MPQLGGHCLRMSGPTSRAMRVTDRGPPDEKRLLALVREARFASGVHCPRCSASHVVRWGGFSGRQRYRCRSCNRTFSDLTGTPLAWTKRLNRWPRHFQCMRHGSTLRVTACEAGIHLSTAFRWRHATLVGVRARSVSDIGGCIELTQVPFAYSEKGARGIDAPRRCGARSHVRLRYETGTCWIVLLRSREGVLQSFCSMYGMPNVTQLLQLFSRSVAAGSTILCQFSRGGGCSAAARQAGHAVVVLRGPSDQDVFHHTANVEAYAWRFKDWMDRFRGVATRYMDNYLAWHRMVDGDVVAHWLQSCSGSAMSGGRLPTVFANTVREVRNSHCAPPQHSIFGRALRRPAGRERGRLPGLAPRSRG
jgi:transposase-like protein